MSQSQEISMTFSVAAINCSGSCQKSLPKNTPGQYIYNKQNPDQQPRFYCQMCFDRLKSQRALTVTNTVSNDSDFARSSRKVNPQAIHDSAKAANKRGAGLAARVTAMGSMGPPQVPGLSGGIPSSQIHLTGTPGYSPNHALYHFEHQKRSRDVFADKDRLILQFEPRYTTKVEKFGIVIGDPEILEGVSVSAHLSIPGIIRKGREALEPRLYAHLGLPADLIDLRWDEVQLRLSPHWIHLNSSANINNPDYDEYFFRENQHKVPTNRKQASGQAQMTQYKKPAKNPLLAFVWEASTWEAIEQLADKLKNPTLEPESMERLSLSPPTRFTVATSNHGHSDTESLSFSYSTNTNTNTVSKRGRADSNSMSDSEAPHTPPRNTKALKPYFSPDGNTLSSVIAAGGLNVVSGIPNVLTDPNRVEEEMHFYPIDHTLDLVDLMRRKPPRFETEDNEFFFKSQVVFYPMQELGRGQFKTACAGQLVCLGSSDYTASFSKCVFKRPFQKTDKVEVKRLIAVEELSILVTEANSHLWASTLLNTSFAYIEKLKNERSVGPPPDVIPNLRFVQAGVGLCLKEQTLKRTKTKKLSFSALIEEMLPPERPFTRFTGNAVANPAPFEDDLDNYFLDFMLFLQHLQYKITQGKCYISDWQGTIVDAYSAILTDAQIISDPGLENKDGKHLFGGGNLRVAFERFTEEHACGEWCAWAQLDSLNVGSGSRDGMGTHSIGTSTPV